jgi:hypothetical protein
VAGVVVEEAERDLVQRGLDGGDLRDDIAWMPRTCPSTRLSRLSSWSLVAV